MSFLATRKSLLRNWSFEGYANFIACFSTVFLSSDLQESVPPVSCEFQKGKKIECVLIIGYLIFLNYLQNEKIFCQFLQVFQKNP